MSPHAAEELPEGVSSLLDTDLYKLTMQCCVLKYFPDVEVTYNFTNRTPHLQLTRAAVHWLQTQIDKLSHIRLTPDELAFLKRECTYLSAEYLDFLTTFQLKPKEHVQLAFTPEEGEKEGDDVRGTVTLQTTGKWLDTILYEIPLLALVSEAYFKFCDRDWDYNGQLEGAREKGRKLLEGGCVFSEFGSRRRRDLHTHELVMQGLTEAAEEGKEEGKKWSGAFTGTSNVHLAMKFGVKPVGTVAHEWFMGVAAVTNNYEEANEIAIRYWVESYGEGVLGIALTDTFGTPNFLKAFQKRVPSNLHKKESDDSQTEPPTYAKVFTGVRQDSGDPAAFVRIMRQFYNSVGIRDRKVIVFSDSLNVDRCFKYKKIAEEQGFTPSFGVGTFFTNDFVSKTTGEKSVPLNIVIKISSAGGRAAVKISDNIGKNTGDKGTVEEVKHRLGYTENMWAEGDERARWGGSPA